MLRTRALLRSSLVLALATLGIACAASGKARIGTNSGASAEGTAESFSEGAPPAPSQTADTADAAPPAPAAAVSDAPRGPVCPVSCVNAHTPNLGRRGELPAAEQDRLAPALADAFQSLRSCSAGARPPSLTLRFDSTSTLTGFGIDDEHARDAMCVDSVRQRWPNVTFSGPATLRCVERCPRGT